MTIDEEKMKELETLAGKLNKATDELSKTIQIVEARIAASSIGLPVWPDIVLSVEDTVFYDDDDVGSNRHVDTVLGYDKVYGDWRFAVRRKVWSVDDTGEIDSLLYDEDPYPLLNASRDLRTLAAEHLESLIDALLKEASSRLETIEGSVKAIG